MYLDGIIMWRFQNFKLRSTCFRNSKSFRVLAYRGKRKIRSAHHNKNEREAGHPCTTTLHVHRNKAHFPPQESCRLSIFIRDGLSEKYFVSCLQSWLILMYKFFKHFRCKWSNFYMNSNLNETMHANICSTVKLIYVS